MFSIQYFEQNLWWGWDCIQVLISKVEMDIGSASAQVNDAIALICESHHVHCQLVATRRLISNFSSQRALVWQEAWFLLSVRVEVGDTNTIGPIGRRDDLWPAEVVNCVSLSLNSELKLNWCCWDWSVTPIAHLRPQTVVGENSRSRGEGVSDHLLIWSYLIW